MIQNDLIFRTYSKDEYNNEPVYFCKSCMSLMVINAGAKARDESEPIGSYCEDCGAVAIGRTSITLWDEAYKAKYKKEYLTGYEIPSV